MNKTENMLLKLNSIEDGGDDFTLKRVKFIIMDEFLSGNKQVVSKDVLMTALKTLKDKPIVAKYFGVEENDGEDALGDHEERIKMNREGELYIGTDTVQIGHFTSEGYFEEFEGKEVLMCDGVLNADRHPDIVALLEEWMSSGIQINSSCEYYYKNYEVIEGVEYVKAPIVFSGHCILNSEQRGDKDVVLGAYSSSRLLSMNQKIAFNSIVNKAISENKEVEDLSKKIVNQESTETVSDESVVENTEAEIVEEVETVQETAVETEEVKEETETEKVEEEVVVEDVEIKQELNAAEEAEEEKPEEDQKETVEELSKKVKELEASEKQLQEKLEKAEATIVELNEKIKELEASEKQLNEIKFNEQLNQRSAEFAEKFKSVNAADKFNTEEVQNLIKESVSDKDALMSLNSMVVDLIPKAKQEAKEDKFATDYIESLNTRKISNLISESDNVLSKYFD